MKYLLGIDLGTTTAKALIVSSDGDIISSATTEYPTYFPKAGWAEQNPEEWWDAARKVIREALSKAKILGSQIKGLSISSHRETIALLDENGEVLDNAIIWMDRRSLPQTEWIKQNLDVSEIYRKTGLIVDPTFTATKLMWLKENKRTILDRAKYALQPKDYLIYRLTGKMTTDKSIASRTMLFDINKLEWSEELFEMFGLKKYMHIFPTAFNSDEEVGYVNKKAAQETELNEGTLVIAGGGDRPCEVLGAGILDSTRVEESTGTGSTTSLTLDKPIIDPKMRVVTSVHVIRGKWALEAGMATAGAVLRWFRDQFTREVNFLAKNTRRRAYEYLDMEAEYIPPGSNGLIVVPFFSGARAPRWNPYARGIIFGLTVYHTRAHIFRALMEGIAYEIRKLLDVLSELGFTITELRVLGGGGKTPTWSRIKADVTGRRVIIPSYLDAALIGDVILAGVGTSLFNSYEEGVRKLVKIKQIIEPNLENKRLYDHYYRLYEEIIKRSQDIYTEIGKITEVPRKEIVWDIDRLIHLLFKLEE